MTETYVDRNQAIAEIRRALKARSGKQWSVTGGRGTAWGWITIESPPARQTARHRLKPGSVAKSSNSEDYEEVDTGEVGGHMTPSDRKELAELLGLESVHCQGVSVPASNAYYQEHIDRANGRTPSVIGQRYWD